MKARLNPLPDATWAGLCALGMDRWLWIDTVDTGLHLESALPAEQPVHASHLWGWSGDRLVRVRLDRDLPGDGLLGGLLDLSDTTGAGEEVAAWDSTATIWSQEDGRIAARLPQGCSGAEVIVWEVRRSPAAGATSAPLHFLQFGPSTTRGD